MSDVSVEDVGERCSMVRKKKKSKQTKERVETTFLPNDWPFLGTKNLAS